MIPPDVLKRPLMLCTVWAGAILLLLTVCLLPDGACAQPKRVDTSDAGNCALCHIGAKVLPDRHVATKGMQNKSCKGCHRGAAASLKGKVPLGHAHLWSGITCGQCHGKVAAPESPGPDSCLVCHGSHEAVAKKTKDLAVNPHQSHFGKIECTSCHKMHRKSENACSKCHDFEMKVP